MRPSHAAVVLSSIAMWIALASGCSSGSSSPGGGDSSGGDQVACVVGLDGGGTEGCLILKDLSSAGMTSATTNCQGVIAPACPTAKLVGCCNIPAAGAGSVPSEQCWYTGTPATYQSLCTGQLKGTWSTSQ